MQQQQRGFTLIELIIVIVILGILAVTAAPKFIDLQGDAKKSTVIAVQGAINSVLTLTHGKALMSSQTGATGTITVDNQSVATVFGYLKHTEDLTGFLDIDTAMAANFVAGAGAAAADQPGVGHSVVLLYNFDDTLYDYSTETTAGCLIYYTEATQSNAATVKARTEDC